MAGESNQETLSLHSVSTMGSADRAGLELLIAYHPDLRRVGERFRIQGRAVSLSRLAPLFSDGEPLADRGISREPAVLTIDGDRMMVAGAAKLQVWRGERWEAGPLRHAEIGERVGLLTLGRHERVLLLLRWGTAPDRDDLGLIGTSEALKRVREQIRLAAGTLGSAQAPVLIRGESGVGKELVARAIHQCSRRSGRFETINAATLIGDHALSEVFGHETGAFTGAKIRRRGALEASAGGTLFIDEIGRCPLAVQSMLLRVVANREYKPLGGHTREHTAALLFATNDDLEAMAASGQFRHDLLNRLGLPIRVPPLRERRADVPILFSRFLQSALADLRQPSRLNAQDGALWLKPELLRALLVEDWCSGNVRMLHTVAERIAALWAEPAVGVAHLREILGAHERAVTLPRPLPPPGALTDADYERAYADNNYNVQRTARALGVSKYLVRSWKERCGLRSADKLLREEIAQALAEGGSIRQAAARLKVSEQGLKARIGTLRMEVG